MIILNKAHAAAFGLVAFTFFLLVYLLFFSSPSRSISDQVEFSAHRSGVFLPSQCVTVDWKAEGASFVLVDRVKLSPSGSTKVCRGSTIPIAEIRSHEYRPHLIAVFPDGSTEEHYLAIAVFTLDLRVWVLLVFFWVGLVWVAAPLDWPYLSPISCWFMREFGEEKQVTPIQLQVAKIFCSILLGLNILPTLIWLSNLHFDSGTLFFVIVSALSIFGFMQPTVQKFLARIFESRYSLFIPLLWYLASIFVLDQWISFADEPAFWLSFQTWSATLFFWSAAYWITAYALRRFEWDRERRFAWLSLSSLAIIILPIAVTVAVWVDPPTSDYWDSFPPTLMGHVAKSNTDAFPYVSYTRGFPFSWKNQHTIQRPSVFMITSQICQVLDITQVGYTGGDQSCSSIELGVFSHWIMNAGIYIFSLLVVYELIRQHLKHHSVAWKAASLFGLSAYNIYIMAIPSTDYMELLIASVSLWLFNELFTQRKAPLGQVVVYGVIIGMMLLLKLNATFLVFGFLLMLGLQRWRVIWALTVLPMMVWVGYTQLLFAFGGIYSIIELGGTWRTFAWLWEELPYYSLYGVARSMSTWTGNVMDMTVLFFGIMFLVGTGLLIGNSKIPRWVALVAGLVFLSTAIFDWVFQYVYISHVVGLIVFIYGGAAFGIVIAQDYFQDRFKNRPSMAKMLVLGIWGIALLHNLAQWGAWDIAFRITYDTNFYRDDYTSVEIYRQHELDLIQAEISKMGHMTVFIPANPIAIVWQDASVFVTEASLNQDQIPYLEPWKSSLSPNYLKQMGIDYLLVENTWVSALDETRLEQLNDPQNYILLEVWQDTHTTFRLYAINGLGDNSPDTE